MIRELFAIFTGQFNTRSWNTVLSKMSYLLFISWRRTRCFEHYTVRTSYCLWESQNLLRHVITRQSKTKKKKIWRNLTMACHRHPTEQTWKSNLIEFSVTHDLWPATCELRFVPAASFVHFLMMKNFISVDLSLLEPHYSYFHWPENRIYITR